MALHTRTSHTRKKNSPIDGDGVQLACAQCHIAPISILRYRESRTIQPKYTFGTKEERTRESYHPTCHHGHANSWYVCIRLPEKAYVNYLDDKLSIWTNTKFVRRKHITQPTGFGAYSLTCFQWDGEVVPAWWEPLKSQPLVLVQNTLWN